MQITFEELEEFDNYEQKPMAISNSDFPLGAIDYLRFEKLIYWIYKNEINQGIWKGKYNRIQLMGGVKDGGKDCALFNNSTNLAAIIQCKHSLQKLRRPILVKEILKFGLYSYLDESLVPNPNSFEYYIAASSGFDEACEKLINDFKQEIIQIGELEEWTNSQINNYAALKHLKYVDVQNYLNDFLTSINVKKIDDNDINNLLNNSYQVNTIKAFFDVRTVIDADELKPIQEKINNIEDLLSSSKIGKNDIIHKFNVASSHLLSSNSYIDRNESIHIERNEVNNIIDWVQSSLENNESNTSMLVGNAGVGKTVILKKVYEDLKELKIPTIGIKADKTYARSITELEEQLNLRESIEEILNILKEEYDKVVVIIDQVDALSQSLSTDRSYLNTYTLLINLLSTYNNVRVIVSTRKFDLEYDPILKSIKKSKIFDISLLKEEQVNIILSQLKIPANNINKKLYQTIRNVHHLKVFCDIYKGSKSLDNIFELQDLYDELWEQKIELLPSTTGITSNECSEMIYIIAEKMNNDQEISIPKKYLNYKINIIHYLISTNILIDDGEKIQFFHQTFYDYAYARNFIVKDYNLLNFVLENNQSLHVRSSIKMILTYLKSYDHKRYINNLIQLITNRKIGFHIKLLIINILGYTIDATESEISFVKRYIIKKWSTYFIESAIGKTWIEFLIRENIFDKLIITKKSVIDKILEKGFITKIYFNKDLFSILNYISFDKRRIDNINLLYRTIAKSINEARVVSINYLSSLPDFNEKKWLITRTLYSLNIWDFKECFLLYDKYKDEIKDQDITFSHILENVIEYDIDWAINQLILYIKEDCDSKGTKRIRTSMTDYHIIKVFEKIIEKDKQKAINLGIEILKISIGEYRTQKEMYEDSSFMFYDRQERISHSNQDFYTKVIDLAEDLALSNKEIFISFYNSNIQSNSHSIIRIIIHALIKNPIHFSTEIVNLFRILHEKQGISATSNTGYWLKKLIKVSYNQFDDHQKAIINNILLSIHSKHEMYIYEDDGKKVHYLKRYGYTIYSFLNCIKEQEIFKQPQLKKIYQELKRKFGPLIDENEPNIVRIRPIGKPMKDRAYKNMNHNQWQDSFVKYNTSEFIFERNGGLWEHANAFKDCVKADPDKFYLLIEKISDENNINPVYILKGLEGLKEANFDANKMMNIYKKAIFKKMESEYTLYFIWLSDYFIKHKIVDKVVIQYLIDNSLNHIDPINENENKDLLTRGINSVRGAAISRLLQCNFNSHFEALILETLEKAIEDRSTAVKACILHYITYMLKKDEYKRVLDIYIKICNGNPELIEDSLFCLKYLVHRDFSALYIHIKRCIKNIPSDNKILPGILTWCWINNYDKSWELLISAHKSNKKAIAESVRIAHENLFSPDVKIRKKCEIIFYKYVNCKEQEVIHEYDVMHLRNDKYEYSFIDWLPYLRSYSRSNPTIKDPHYFLELLLQNTAQYPKDCLKLISNYKKYSKPNMSSGPFHSNEPVKIVLGAYNVFHNKGERKYIIKSIKLFNSMLKVDYLRKEADNALELVDR